MKVEVICCTARDCALAEATGAHRIELCAAIELGGLTPSLGLLQEGRTRTTVPLLAMLRPRGGGFGYSEEEFATMVRDAAHLAEHGADGLVTGVLSPDGTIDRYRLAHLIATAPKVEWVCHRAFDQTPDPFDALESLIELGFRRVLTSGHRKSAADGADVLRALIERAAGRIEILPGGGIRPGNVKDLVSRTGCDQVHLGPFVPTADPSHGHNPQVPGDGAFGVIDVLGIRQTIANLSPGN